MSDKNKVAIYCTGGAGINIGNLLSQAPLSNQGFATPQLYYIDTSDSNLRRTKIDMEQVFLFENVDGSGKVRAENHAVISKNILKIIQSFPPTTFNIIVCSASGGSGSVIGHSLAVELRKRGEQVIMVIVGTTGSHIEIENTMKSLKSLDSMAEKMNKPVVVHYLENSESTPRHRVDAQAVEALVMLLGLFSGQHRELDTADLKNWLNHPKLDPQLVSLHFAVTQEAYDCIGEVTTLATLARPEMNTTMTPVPAYQAVGFVPDEWTSEKARVPLIGNEPINYAIGPDLISEIAKSLKKRLDESTARLSARVRRDSLHDSSEASGDGIIL